MCLFVLIKCALGHSIDCRLAASSAHALAYLALGSSGIADALYGSIGSRFADPASIVSKQLVPVHKGRAR